MSHLGKEYKYDVTSESSKKNRGHNTRFRIFSPLQPEIEKTGIVCGFFRINKIVWKEQTRHGKYDLTLEPSIKKIISGRLNRAKTRATGFAVLRGARTGFAVLRFCKDD